MSKILKLYNTFTRELNPVKIAGKHVELTKRHVQDTSYGSFYICGPTVYSDSHLGHALTYIRADLLRRFLRSLFNLRLLTVMNITDIDDKILLKTSQEFGIDRKSTTSTDFHSATAQKDSPLEHPYNKISERYYNSFLTDMDTLRVLPADLYVRVSRSMHLITDYIRELERKNYTYFTESGDINFRVSSMKNYKGRVDERKEKSDLHKRDQRDFALWKSAKPGEPVWLYNSSALNNKSVAGRPGWHVQCSAISNALFGNKLDFHFGGKDLIFPHHYNEEACCCAYHQLDTDKTMHVWTQNWLHSGHLVFRDAKMSKSLGNVISIKDFIKSSSVNFLRLLCIYSHYRSDLEFNADLMDAIKTIDHKINAFASYLSIELRKVQDNLEVAKGYEDSANEHIPNDIQNAIISAREEMAEGVCDDFHLNRGLEAMLNLSKLVYSKDVTTLGPLSLIAVQDLFKEWCDICGLEYGIEKCSSSGEALLDLISNFRQQVRSLTLRELKESKRHGGPGTERLQELLKECDSVRSRLDDLGYVFRDEKS